jgi:hypothetical protein
MAQIFEDSGLFSFDVFVVFCSRILSSVYRRFCIIRPCITLPLPRPALTWLSLVSFGHCAEHRLVMPPFAEQR